LLAAETIRELVVHNEERQTLWKSLRERAIQSQGYVPSELAGVDLDPSVLAALLGIPLERAAKG
jgi:hypothetical protein